MLYIHKPLNSSWILRWVLNDSATLNSPLRKETMHLIVFDMDNALPLSMQTFELHEEEEGRKDKDC